MLRHQTRLLLFAKRSKLQVFSNCSWHSAGIVQLTSCRKAVSRALTSVLPLFSSFLARIKIFSLLVAWYQVLGKKINCDPVACYRLWSLGKRSSFSYSRIQKMRQTLVLVCRCDATSLLDKWSQITELKYCKIFLSCLFTNRYVLIFSVSAKTLHHYIIALERKFNLTSRFFTPLS